MLERTRNKAVAATIAEITAQYDRIALVFQGGGALGAYQAGVYQALADAGCEPTWLSGVSIGAINASIIAGNEPSRRLQRLEQFWQTISGRKIWAYTPEGDVYRDIRNQTSSFMTMTMGQPGFFKPRSPNPWFQLSGAEGATSFYDTAELKDTLESLIDFDVLNDGKKRLSVGAVNVRTGNFVYFDTDKVRIGPEHIMASGALPPAFPSIRIEGEYYWDGGIVSNTPLDYVLEHDRDSDLLIFQVDLFSARGEVPATVLEAAEREKDIRYSSRTRMNTDMNKKIHDAKKAVRELIAKLPESFKDDPLVATLNEAAKENTVTVVHLIYRSKLHENSSKDYDFSRLGMTEHWAAGERDVYASMSHPEWLNRPQSDETMVTYDLCEAGSEKIK